MWDYSREEKVPTVFLPSQWLSISLRFLERTNDDYSSFVSFLNLPINDRLLDVEQIYAILSGISEYTTDYVQQSNLLQKFISIRTEKRLADQKSDTLLNESRIFAKTELEMELESRQNSLQSAEEQLKAEKEARVQFESDNRIIQSNLKSDLANLESKLATQNGTIEEQGLTISSLSQENEDLRKFKNRIITIGRILVWGCAFLVLMLITVLCFFFHEWEYNVIHSLMKWLNQYEDIERNLAIAGIIFIYASTLFFVGKKLIARCREL